MKGIGGLTVPTKPQRHIFTLKYHLYSQIMLWHLQTAAKVYRSRTGLTKVMPSGTLGSFILKVVSNEVNTTHSTANSSSLPLLIRFIAEINFKEGFEKPFTQISSHVHGMAWGRGWKCLGENKDHSAVNVNFKGKKEGRVKILKRKQNQTFSTLLI